MEGYRKSGRDSYAHDNCPNCRHPYARHFWWEQYGSNESIRGCEHCPRETCTHFEAVTNMSSVNICERCNSLMLQKALGTLDLMRSHYDVNERSELCPACIGELDTWLKERPERDRGTAFTKPWEPAPETSETMVMLEAGPCGEMHTDNGVEFMCLRPKGHKGYHIDGNKEWVSAQ